MALLRKILRKSSYGLQGPGMLIMTECFNGATVICLNPLGLTVNSSARLAGSKTIKVITCGKKNYSHRKVPSD